MNVIILAAGRGSRLGNLDYPKALTQLNEKETILSRQIEILEKIPNAFITLVLGYRKEKVIQLYPSLNIVENPDYSRENTAKSLLRALRTIEDDVLWLNGDVVFESSVLDKLLEMKTAAMLVNRGAVGEEEVKYTCNDLGYIKEISKEVLQGEGEALGINYFPIEAVSHLRKALEECSLNDYFEKAIEKCIKKGMKVTPVIIPSHFCVEIDFQEDLEKARNLMKTWNTPYES